MAGMWSIESLDCLCVVKVWVVNVADNQVLVYYGARVFEPLAFIFPAVISTALRSRIDFDGSHATDLPDGRKSRRLIWIFSRLGQ